MIVNDPLAWVVARFEKGAIHPMRFRWKQREFAVRAVHARWTDRSTRPIRWCFAVSVASGEWMELCYREGDPVWRLTQVDADRVME